MYGMQKEAFSFLPISGGLQEEDACCPEGEEVWSKSESRRQECSRVGIGPVTESGGSSGEKVLRAWFRQGQRD